MRIYQEKQMVGREKQDGEGDEAGEEREMGEFF